jgi:hypothetical protein
LSKRLSYYAVVQILSSERTKAVAIDGRTGVVLGISDSGEHVEYGVLIDAESYMVDSADLTPTGEVLSRETIYGGSSARVQPQRFPKEDPE